jgi:hypothetical protein
MRFLYDSSQYREDNYPVLPPGKYRVRIEGAEETRSKNGREMVKLTLSVAGTPGRIFHYLVVNEDTPETIKITNQRFGELFNSFGIPAGDMNVFKSVSNISYSEIY